MTGAALAIIVSTGLAPLSVAVQAPPTRTIDIRHARTPDQIVAMAREAYRGYADEARMLDDTHAVVSDGGEDWVVDFQPNESSGSALGRGMSLRIDKASGKIWQAVVGQ